MPLIFSPRAAPGSCPSRRRRLRNHGNYVISINKLVKWLGGLVEQAGVNVFTQFAGAELIYEGEAVAGVITEDKGRDKDGKPKDNFTPGYELRAKVTVLAEGPARLADQRPRRARKISTASIRRSTASASRSCGKFRAGRIAPGWVAHTLGWPLDSSMYGGGWIYGLRENRVSLGLVTGLEYHNPRFDPHEAFQQFKTHPFVRPILEGGKLVRYGAKTVPVGGWYSMPRTYVDGGADHRRFREPAQFPAPEGHSHGHQERDACRRDDSGSAARGRRFRRASSPPFRRKVEESWVAKRTARRAQFPSSVSARPLARPGARRRAICHRRPRA